MDDFLQKLKKVVRIVLYGPAISQSDFRKAGPYQLPCYKMTNYKSNGPKFSASFIGPTVLFQVNSQ